MEEALTPDPSPRTGEGRLTPEFDPHIVQATAKVIPYEQFD